MRGYQREGLDRQREECRRVRRQSEVDRRVVECGDYVEDEYGAEMRMAGQCLQRT
jgi:hypothetical protein